jgi:adenylate cyclase
MERSSSGQNAASPAVAGLPTPEEVRAQLDKILASPTFRRSERLHRFLHHVVEQTLAGESSQLKEYTLGRIVFDRGDHFNPSSDSIVRVEARRLRNKLQEYYAQAGSSDPVVIGMVPGTYAPVLQYKTPHSAAESSEPELDVRAVAVLPFVNMSPDPSQDFFCDGITEELLNTLAAIPELRVVARTSVFFFKGKNIDVREIGKKLGVGTIIEGSVRKADDQLRITVQAVDATTGVHLWSNTFDRNLVDIFTVQDEIANEVADALRISLVPDGKRPALPCDSAHLEAYVYYLKGRHFWNQVSEEGVTETLNLYTQAISVAPDYAPPYLGLSVALCKLAFWGVLSPKEGVQKAKHAVLEALRLDPRSAGAHATLGLIVSMYEWDRESALPLFRRSLELEPSSVLTHTALAIHHLCLGEFSETRAAIEKCTQLDPISPFSFRSWGWFHYFTREYDRSIADFEAALSIDPRFLEVRFFLANAYMRKDRYQEAIEALNELPDHPLYRAPKWGATGEASALAGDIDSARKALARLEAPATTGYVSPMSRATIHAALGDRENAFAELERAYDDRSIWLNFAKVDPRFDPLRSDPRFASLLQRIHLA